MAEVVDERVELGLKAARENINARGWAAKRMPITMEIVEVAIRAALSTKAVESDRKD